MKSLTPPNNISLKAVARTRMSLSNQFLTPNGLFRRVAEYAKLKERFDLLTAEQTIEFVLVN